jgi:BirA family biotin operon repressor/biotin-[acetyl-CoA-carboxylase] ligase
MKQSNSIVNVFGKEIIHLSHIDSTNNFAATLISDQLCQNGTAILADSQSFGKGQRGNSWYSEPGKNLLVSFILKPDNLSVLRQQELTWITSICIVQTLRIFNIESQIKWPNDILIRGKKIAGILIENQLSGEFISNSIIGIGLNVNQTDFNGIEATSIQLEFKKEISVEIVFNELCHQMNSLFREFHESESNKPKSVYETLLYQKNEPSFYEDENGKFQGEIIGIKNNGFLEVKVGEEVREYGIKEIRYCSK